MADPLIFDVHQHVPAAPPARSDGSYDVEADLEYRRKVMAHRGVRAAILMANHQYERPNGQADTRRQNDFVAWYVRAHAGMFPAGIGVVEPVHGLDAGLAEIHRLRELGLSGVVWHNYFQATGLEDARIAAFVQELGQLGMVAFVHLVAGMTAQATPRRLAALARKCPDTTIVALCPFSHLAQMGEVQRLAEECPNVLFDTSLVWPINRWTEHFAETIGANRVLFGTDLHYHEGHAPETPAVLAEVLASERLSDAGKEAILWGNAARLFPTLSNLSP